MKRQFETATDLNFDFCKKLGEIVFGALNSLGIEGNWSQPSQFLKAIEVHSSSRVLLCFCLATLCQSYSACSASDWLEDEDANLPFRSKIPPKEQNGAQPLQDQFSDGASRAIPQERLSANQKLSAMEYELYGKSFPNTPMAKRLDLLESKVLQPDQDLNEGNVIERIERLYRTVNPSDENKRKATELRVNSFLNPPECEWLNSLGRGLRRGGSSILSIPRSLSNEVGSAFSSGEILEDAVGTSALYSGFNIIRSPGFLSPSYGSTNTNRHWVNGYSRNGVWIPGHRNLSMILTHFFCRN